MDVKSRKRNPQSEGILAENSELGADGVAALPIRLDRYGRAHQRALHMSDYVRSAGEIKLANNLNQCGHWLVFRHYYTVDKLRLHAADFCKKHLLCPLCAVRRAAKYLKAYMDKLEFVLAETPNLKAYMVTVTVVDGPSLPERFKHLRKAMKSMTLARRHYLNSPDKRPHVEFAKALGGVHSIEAKRGSGSGLWHPHAHMVWLCHEEPDQAKLSQEWKEWTGDSFIVDVRPFHDQQDVVSGFIEVFKYALKFSELSFEDNWEAFKQLSGKRLVDSFGLLRGVQVSDDLTDEPLEDLPYIELFYQWFNRSGYSLMKTKTVSEISEQESSDNFIKSVKSKKTSLSRPNHLKISADGLYSLLTLLEEKNSSAFDPTSFYEPSTPAELRSCLARKLGKSFELD